MRPNREGPRLRPIVQVAHDLGLSPDEVELYGPYKAKILPAALQRVAKTPPGKLVLVTAITPTPMGEGKTLTTIGLGDALARVGAKACVTIREPSLGPIFGIKGGATGGGAASVHPLEDVNLHFTGDKHAVTSANNLLATMIDTHIHHGNTLRIDPTRIVFRRCLDMNDRALRNIVVGLGGKSEGVPREGGFIITAASEVMAILCLSDDLSDLKRRLGEIIVAYDLSDRAVRARDLGVEGAMAVLLKDALKANLVQTTGGTPAIIHGGPFANIAHGTNSILATRLALRLSEYVVTEAGFGADLGAEKFLDIVCRRAGFWPSAAVLVVSCRALKMHGMMASEDQSLAALVFGMQNLDKHVENLQSFGLPVVVAVNRFAADTEEEIEAVRSRCTALGVPCAVHELFAKGGAGGEDLARLVIEATRSGPRPARFLYADDESVKAKIEKVATEIYGADGVDYDYRAEQSLKKVRELGLDRFPICIAKTQASLSDDPKRKGRPRGWRLTVRDVYASAGAGFLVVVAGDIVMMPGLGRSPAALKMDLTDDGTVVGLS
ncbi:MAG: formate--tetrahydrofolate ligase [Methanobacteriota archaeon]